MRQLWMVPVMVMAVQASALAQDGTARVASVTKTAGNWVGVRLEMRTVAAQTAPATSRVPTCAYSAQELRAALGLDLQDGKPGKDVPFAGGRTTSCRYEPKSVTSPAFTLNLVVMDDANSKDTSYLRMVAGTKEPIPGDPDAAFWQTNQGDLTNAALWYVRRGVTVEARVWLSPRDPKFSQFRAKLAALRRIP